ncbi:MAG: hypothetical protein R3349_03890 [Geminicoccaceae bacterium]|nr:hypothetical protein [Geminicoccaceae bacterium]
MTYRLTWDSKRAVGRFAMPMIRRRMEFAGRQVVQEQRARLGQPHPPTSRPGEAPRRRSGELQRSIAGEVARERRNPVFRLSANVPYAAFLAFGTSRMAARTLFRLGRAQIQRFLRAIERR